MFRAVNKQTAVRSALHDLPVSYRGIPFSDYFAVISIHLHNHWHNVDLISLITNYILSNQIWVSGRLLVIDTEVGRQHYLVFASNTLL